MGIENVTPMGFESSKTALNALTATANTNTNNAEKIAASGKKAIRILEKVQARLKRDKNFIESEKKLKTSLDAIKKETNPEKKAELEAKHNELEKTHNKLMESLQSKYEATLNRILNKLRTTAENEKKFAEANTPSVLSEIVSTTSRVEAELQRLGSISLFESKSSKAYLARITDAATAPITSARQFIVTVGNPFKWGEKDDVASLTA